MIEYRGPDGDDLHFVLSSWLQSYRLSSPCINIPPHVYFKEQESKIKNLIVDSQLLIACNKLDPGQIFGWACFQPDVFHYVYVKSTFRKNGIARELFRRSGMPTDKEFFYTHTPYIFYKNTYETEYRQGTFRAERLCKNGIYNPYLLERP